jgi:hypothetical protein
MRIGIDFGGVLTESTTPPQSGNFLSATPSKESFETIARWNKEGHTTMLISKARKANGIQAKARIWLAHYKFDKLFTDGMQFCEEQQGKIDICSREGIDVMIDDTAKQLEMLGGVVLHRVLFGADSAPEGLHAAPDWLATRDLVAQL